MKPYSLRSFVLSYDEKPYSLRSFVLSYDEKPYFAALRSSCHSARPRPPINDAQRIYLPRPQGEGSA
jgi:hypothetical protein